MDPRVDPCLLERTKTVVKVAIRVGPDEFRLETDAPLADVRVYLDEWFKAIDHADERPPRIVFSIGPVSEQGA